MRPAILYSLALALGLSFASVPQSASPQADAPAIVFVAAPMFDERTDGGDGVYQGSYHWRDGYVYARSATYHRAERTMGPTRPGKNLYALLPGKQLKQLTFLKTGAVYKPEPSFDGKKVLFAMRRDGEDWFNLYEINVDGSNLRQLTDGPFNDFAGTYLPDGRIVFCSDRTGYLEEYHEERTECLFVMNGDGTGIHQITFAPGTYFEPSMMADGRILFSFWDAFHIDVPPLEKHETYLMTVNPDGTEERHLFGAGQYRFFNRQRHGGIGFTQARELPDGRIVCQSEFGPSLLDPSRGTRLEDALTPIFPGTTSVQLGGTGHAVHLSPLGTRSTPYPTADSRILFSATQPGARDSAIHICNPDTREEKLVYDIPNYAEFDAVPVLVNRQKPRRIPNRIADPAQYSSGCVWKTEPTKDGKPSPNAARFLVVAGRETDQPQRTAAMQKARYFRVIEAEYTGVTTSSHTNLETRILGTVPILEDGSTYFEAPADTPIFLDPIDAAGNRVLYEWSYPNTSVPERSLYPGNQLGYMVGRAGETKSCYGCHAPQTQAVPNVTVEALKYGPVKITRESTDLQYRRNEPEAYRRQARIGEAPKHRSWLASKDAVARAKACEMLMYLEDGVEADVPAIAKLLTDQSVEVRRSAALALTRLASVDEATLLKEAAEKDSDWQVRFHAKNALAAIQVTGNAEPDLEALGRLRHRATAEQRKTVRDHLAKPGSTGVPPVAAIRAAGRLKDAEAVKLLVPWLTKHESEYHAGEAAVALGRIGTPEAIAALWAAVRTEVPNKKVLYARYLQHGPRPEEYALLKGLLLANAKPSVEDVHLLIALLPNTFTEKPRFEDRLREESQRVLMPRQLLENAGLRRPLVSLLAAALAKGEKGKREKGEVDRLAAEVIKGINLERPFAEHGRPFPVVKDIGAEEALWLLTCLAESGEVPEGLVVYSLTAENHRERIDAAVLLGLHGMSAKGLQALAAEIAKPYTFPEIWSVGKGMDDYHFRDKAYMAQSLAMHIPDVERLRPFADPKAMYRDIRYGLTRGLARRGKSDGIPLLLEMAGRDPLTLIRQQARYALADVQDACRIRGEAVPAVSLPASLPLEALYPPRGLKWADQTADALPGVELTSQSATDAGQALKTLLNPADFRNLNMAQAYGAEQMMVRHVAEFGAAVRRLPAENSGKLLADLLDAPYPHANFMAIQTLAERADPKSAAVLAAKLDAYVKARNTVGFWWCCEGLAKLQAKEAMPLLAKYAVATNPTGVHGPAGMGVGYIASQSLARIAKDPKQADVARLLNAEDVWLKAGVIRGLAEVNAPGVEEILRKAARPENAYLLQHEAEIQLRRLQKDADSSAK